MSLEKEIIELLRSDAKAAIPMIYDHYADNLYGVLMSILGDEDDAQEVLQESFIKYWKKAATYDARKSRLFTWLLNIARNGAIDHLRKRGRKIKREIQADVSDVYNVSVEGIDPDTMDMRKQIGTLDIKQQLVLEALYFKGMTQQEASEALDMPLGSVKTSLRLAMRELRKIFNVDIMTIALILKALS
ncbi:MAG: sigma-70 family RNA polymerase sigma factor [Flavobacteriales bacterium]|nr:sigma-70 family RNA polymerase sigma factor [Flavobacteriales bacterium]